jgi:Tol biopolymer transport system component
MDADRVRVQLKRILSSPAFADAERGSRFLRFVVEATMEGRSSEIKESVIGVEVLGRSTSFDPKTDPIVRVEAGRLRSRLNTYYQNEGKADPVLISLPKGGYVPEFSDNKLATSAQKTTHPALFLMAGALMGFAASALLLSYFRKASEPADVLRLSILPPRGAVIEHSAISPDGKRIAFSAVSAGKLELWIRPLDSLEATALPGTEDASYPFWSPDGRSLGFVARTTLKRIGISGGPAQILCNVGPFRGGAWGSAGVIVYGPHPVGVLYQIPASGGGSKPATALDPARGEIAHEFPHFLPDGRHFLYFAVSSRSGESSIRVGALDSMDSKFLVNADASAVYAPGPGGQRGFLLFVYGGSLLAQPFDPRALELGGERMVVVPKIPYRIGHADFSVSASGVLAYRAGTLANRQLAWFTREGRLLGTVGSPNDYYAWSLSPDERRLAIMQSDPSGAGSSIWIMELATLASSKLTGGSGFAFTPVWSPDASEVLFSTGTERAMSLRRQAVNARVSVDVLESEGPKFLSDWSSDGRFVAYFTPWPDWKKLNLFFADVARPSGKENPRPAWPSDYSEASGSFSSSRVAAAAPRWIAYTSDETGRDEVYVRNFPAGDRKWLVSTAGGWLPHWRPDGKKLFYLTLDGTLTAVDVKEGRMFESGSPQPLFHTGIPPWEGPPEVPTSDYAVSKDGQRFLINGTVEAGTASPITVVIQWQANLR